MGKIQQLIREQGITDELKDWEMRVNQQMEDRKKQEEILWKHKSHILWLKEGERNTKFFHRTSIQRRHSNKITHLISDEGETIHSHADMENILLEYFQGLLIEPIQDR